MLPTTTAPPPSDHHHHHHHTKKSKLKATIYSVNSHISGRHCAWLIGIILLQLILLLYLNPASSPPPIPSPTRRFESALTASPPRDEACKHGRIYVYDLPPMFNKELLDNCDDLDPWSSKCNTVSNAGIGPPATGLESVVPENLTAAWYWTDMYAAEVIYHDRINNYKCTTHNQSEASAFYIPFYAGLAVGKYLWLINCTSKDRDYHAAAMLDWVKDQTPWRISNGSDHFLMFGRLTWDFRRLSDEDSDWGSKFLNMPLMKNVLRLTVERSQWDDLEISVPYPTAFHPRSESDIRQWQKLIRTRKRSSLFTFVGATRKSIKNDFRGVLMNYCKNETTTCRVVDCSVTHCYDGAPEILDSFLHSDFCFQPKGDGYTRRSAYDCMLAGSIPVYFWNRTFDKQYEWHLPDPSKYSVFIDRRVVRNDTSIIRRTLENYSREKVKEMRETIIHYLPGLLYSKSNTDLGGTKDAFDIAMEGALKRFEQQRRLRG